MTRDPNSPFHVANDDDARQERREREAEVRAAGEEALARLVEWYEGEIESPVLLDAADRYVRALGAAS